jgi:hypothetical protein
MQRVDNQDLEIEEGTSVEPTILRKRSGNAFTISTSHYSSERVQVLAPDDADAGSETLLTTAIAAVRQRSIHT